MQLARPLSVVHEEFFALGEGAGYVSAGIDTRTNSLTIYWHGPPVADHLRITADAKARGINVDIVSVPFSTAELMTAADALFALIDDREVGCIEYNNGSGLIVHFRSAALTEAAQAALADSLSRAEASGAVPDNPFYSPPGAPQITISDDPMDPVPGSL